MKPSAIRIERILEKIEARLVPPPLRVLQVKVYEARDKEKALAEVAARYPDAFAGRTVEDINWSDDLAAAQAEALAEHIAAHPENAGRTVEDFRWIVREIVLEPQEDEFAAKEAEVEDKKIENDIVVPVDASDKDAAVSSRTTRAPWRSPAPRHDPRRKAGRG